MFPFFLPSTNTPAPQKKLLPIPKSRPGGRLMPKWSSPARSTSPRASSYGSHANLVRLRSALHCGTIQSVSGPILLFFPLLAICNRFRLR